MSLPSRTSLRRGEACRLGSSGAMAQSCAITLKTTLLKVYHKFAEFAADLISAGHQRGRQWILVSRASEEKNAKPK